VTIDLDAKDIEVYSPHKNPAHPHPGGWRLARWTTTARRDEIPRPLA
jgi:hypothetical protein